MSLLDSDRTAKQSDEVAAYWVQRLDAPDCGPSDRSAFETWRNSSPEHARAFDRAQKALAMIDRNLGSPELLKLSEQVLLETGDCQRARQRRLGMGFAAACMLVVTAGIYQAVNLPNDDQPIRSANIYETGVGERSTVTLSDDSTITLDTDSLVQVDFTENSDIRRLELMRGQAHFEVEKDSRVFEVYAGDRRIVALGTAFDVRLDEEQGVLITLVEGRIEVDEIANDVPGIVKNFINKAPAHTELAAGEQLIAKPDSQPKVLNADMERVVGWREGRLVFRDDALRDVVQEINRYSTRKLVLNDDARLDNIRVGGVFATGSTSSFVEAMEMLYPVKAKPAADGHIALLWRDSTGQNEVDRVNVETSVRESESSSSRVNEVRF